MSSNGYDKMLILTIPMGTLKDLAAVAVMDYLKAITTLTSNEEVVELKFGAGDEIKELSGDHKGMVPLIIKVKYINDPIMEEVIKGNGKGG